MSDVPAKAQSSPLSRAERLVAAGVGVLAIIVSLVIVLAPPGRRVALAQCPNAAAGCIVTVDTDLTTFAAVLATIGATGLLIALLGVRFNKMTVAGTVLSYEDATQGLTQAPPALSAEVNPPAAAAGNQSPQRVPVEVQLREGLGKQLGTVPVAVTELTKPIREVDWSFLRDYQSARKESQHSFFLTHILGPATRKDQKYSVAIRLTPHRGATAAVTSAAFYLGRAWGNKIFDGRTGPDGRFGIATEAYGPFLALCEVEFDDGSRILLDHYCDFDMGKLLPG
jgi:hypothetical protein